MPDWPLPSLDLPNSENSGIDDEAIDMGIALTEKFASLGVQCEVEDISVGPSTITFALNPGPKARMMDFRRLSRADDIAQALGASSVRISTPSPGLRTVGVEVSSPVRRHVLLGDLFDG
jgi:DNA segregation ATPase FtsK/SpoIIIE, S-DNA-T family